MVTSGIDTDWEDGAEAYVERRVDDIYTFVAQPSECVFGHVEAGGWSGDRACFAGKHGLVALYVVSGRDAVHVGWQWH